MTTTDITAHHSSHGDSNARFVLLQCCLAGNDVAPALADPDVGVDCVIGYLQNINTGYVGWQKLLEYMCDEGKSAREAYDQVCDDYPQEFHDVAPALTVCIGNTDLWGVPL